MKTLALFLIFGKTFAQNLAPVADFTANQAADCLKKFTFQNQSINEPLTFSWDFGDGITSTATNPTHIYQNFGNFTVVLLAQNPQGNNTKKLQISIPDNLNIVSGMAGVTAIFQGISTINAKNIVNSDANVSFRATKTILLTAGFRADNASIFKAEIGGCGN